MPVYCLSWFHLSVILKRLKLAVTVSVWKVSHYWCKCITTIVMLNILELLFILGLSPIWHPFSCMARQAKSIQCTQVLEDAECVNTTPCTVPWVSILKYCISLLHGKAPSDFWHCAYTCVIYKGIYILLLLLLFIYILALNSSLFCLMCDVFFWSCVDIITLKDKEIFRLWLHKKA